MKKAINVLLDFLKGFLLGFVCLATPGLSAGTIAVIIGAFTQIINAGNDLFHNWFSKNWWKTILFFLILGIGAVVGAFVGSKVVGITFEKYPCAVTLCLIGFVIGSLPMIFENIKSGVKHKSNWLVFTIVLILVILYTFLVSGEGSVSFDEMNFGKYLALVAMGAITVATMIIPGISGNIFLMAFGYYYPLVEVLNNISTNSTSYTIKVIIPFIIGCILGALLIIKLIKILLDKFEMKTNVAIFAFVVATPIVMVKLNIINNLNEYTFGTAEIIIGIALALVAFALSFIIGRISIKKSREKDTIEE